MLRTTFAHDERGAAAVDWVVLSAILVGLGLAVNATLGPAYRGQATHLGTTLEADIVSTDFR